MSKISLKSEFIDVQEIWEDNLLFWIREVYKIYKNKDIETIALKNLNLKLYRGEFLAILGPSGSGKTSLLKILSGLMPCTTGRIYYMYEDNELVNFAKYDLGDRTIFRRDNVGYISQDFNLFDYLTVEQNIQIPLFVKYANEKDLIKENSDIDWVLKACEIEHRREYNVENLSGGEKQRVQIAMALITKPSIIIADEPTGNLDSGNAMKIFSLLQKISKTFQTTILTVSHDVLIENYVDRILYLKDGSINERV